MKLNEAEQVLDGFLQDVVSTLGFQRTETLIYSRPANDPTALLSFPSRVDARGPAHFSCNVWLHFASLEPYLRGPNAKLTIPTITMPLHLLRQNRSFMEWQFYRSPDLENLRGIITTDLQDHALPFIEEYSMLPRLLLKLESLNPRDWFVLDPEQRLNLLAVIRFVQGDRGGALKFLDDALLERKGALPKKRLPIEAVRKRLAEGV